MSHRPFAELVCASGHKETIRLDASFGLELAQAFAGFMDGTLAIPGHPPEGIYAPGTCIRCGKRFQSKVLGHEVDAEAKA